MCSKSHYTGILLVMILTDYKHIDRAEWEGLLRESPVATWFQSAEAYEFFSSLSDIMTSFVFAVSRGNALKGVGAGYITKEKNSVKQYFTRRAIIYGGPLLAEDISDEELHELLSAVVCYLSSRAIYIETRNFNDYSRWRPMFERCGFRYQPHLNFHVDTSSVDVIQNNLGKNRKRDIRVSLRDGARIVDNPTLEQVRDYYTILQLLYQTKVRTPLFPWDFFQKLYDSPSSRFLLVEYESKIIGGTVCVVLDGKAIYEWFVCGEDGKYKNIFPSELATYAGMQFAAEKGCTRFDMMGAGTPDEHYGVRDFKARFGGELVEHGRYLRINNKPLYQVGKAGVSAIRSVNGCVRGGGVFVCISGC